jgi:hypothetical protein
MRTTVKLYSEKKKQRVKISTINHKKERNEEKENKAKDNYFIKNKNRHHVDNTEKSTKFVTLQQTPR